MTSDSLYYLSERDKADILAVMTMVRFTKLPSVAQSAPYWRAAGQHLADLRRRHRAADWKAIVQNEIGMSARRAYELVSVAEGRQTVEQLRSSNLRRVKKMRENKRTASTRDRKRPKEQAPFHPEIMAWLAKNPDKSETD
jgi:hypothetical protein